MLRAGDTFLLPKPNATEHLWVVLTEPTESGEAVCVNITTQHSFSDQTVILQPGDHPFIKHPSVVHYEDAREMNLQMVYALLKQGSDKFVCVAHDPCSVDLLRCVRDGLLRSKRTPNGLKQRCKALWETR